MLTEKSTPERNLLLALAVGFGVLSGVNHLGSKPFWIDESIAVLPAREILIHGVPRSPFDVDFMRFQVSEGVWDPSAPLYRYAVAGFVAIFGFSELTTRGFSLLFGALMVLLTWLFARRTTDGLTAWLSAIVLLTTPDFIELAREARHFSFVGACGLLTYYGLVRCDGEDRIGPALWPAGLVAAVLGHATGYLIVPVVASYLLLAGWRKHFRRPLIPYYLLLAGLLIAIVVPNAGTLPFFHAIGCENRVAGCHPSPWFYLGAIAVFLTGSHSTPPTALSGWAIPLLIPLLALLGGLARSAALARRHRGALLLVLATVLPLLLLSTRELKFPRYLFYCIPLYSVLVALGVTWMLSLIERSAIQRAAAALLAVFLMWLPYGAEAREELELESRTARLLEKRSKRAPDDNFERIREKLRFISEHAGPGDEIVTSFDDASLSYYTGRFVHGFLNSRHDDTHFLALLRKAERVGSHVIFIDTLERHDYCHTATEPLKNIPCRDKYHYFYRECAGPSPNPVCIRGVFP